jgi:hypothetical protein
MSSAFEHHAEKVAFAPHQAACSHRPKAIEGNAEFDGQDAEPAQSNTGAVVCDVADAARMNLVLAPKNSDASRLMVVLAFARRSKIASSSGKGAWLWFAIGMDPQFLR